MIVVLAEALPRRLVCPVLTDEHRCTADGVVVLLFSKSSVQGRRAQHVVFTMQFAALFLASLVLRRSERVTSAVGVLHVSRW